MPPTATSSPDVTATASAQIAQQWQAGVGRIGGVNRALGDLGTRFNNGAIGMADGSTQLQQLDQQAASAAQSIQSLPAPPAADQNTFSHYRQTVSQWAGAIHTLNVEVANGDVFRAPGQAQRVQQLAQDVESQGAGLSLPGSG